MVHTAANVELFRQQLQRILSSADFASSRQLREYFQYLAEAAFSGRTQLEQAEIAEGVLHRGKDFNPVDDASVRKLATLLRQKLAAYYAGEGAQEDILVTLPTRSYIPVFRSRETLAPAARLAPVAEAAPLEIPTPRRRRAPAAFLTLALLGLLLIALAAYTRRPAPLPEPVFHFATAAGDIMHRDNSLSGDALQLGPAIGPYDHVTVRMTFSPERATQQAGIMLYADADHYVKLGRQFNSRVQLEFGVEIDGRYQKPTGTFAYDPLGQTGAPLWLSIRRQQSKFFAMVSSDGINWKPFGNEIELPVQTPLRVALYAHNGRSNAPSTRALFDRLTIGSEFHSANPTTNFAEATAGWRLLRSPESPAARWDNHTLLFPFDARDRNYSTSLLQPAPQQDWTISTRLDFQSLHGAAAGLTVHGERSHFRLIRWDLDGGSITAEHLGHKQANLPDFGGEPPVLLRIQCRDGILRSSFSRDGLTFQELPLRVPLRELGQKIEYGLEASRSTWSAPQEYPPARFHFFHREINSLVPYR